MNISDDLIAYTGLSEILVDNLGLITIEMNKEMQKCGIKRFKNKQLINHLLSKHKELNEELNKSVDQVESEGKDGEGFLEMSYFSLQLNMLAVAIKPNDREKALKLLESFKPQENNNKIVVGR